MDEQPTNMDYRLNEVPPWPRLMLYGVQWAVIFLPTIFVVASIAAEFLGLSGREEILFMQRLLLVTGAGMILQTIWGHRYPLLDGPASALLLSFIVLAPEGLPVIQGGMIAGGAVLFALSVSKWIRLLRPLFTDRVVGVILILIAVTLLPYLTRMMIGVQGEAGDGDALTFGISVCVVFAVALFGHWLPGFAKTIPLLLGILVGTVLMGLFGRLEMGGLREASWLSVPGPLLPGMPRFTVPAMLTFLIAYVAVIANALGSIYGMAEVVGKDGLPGRLERGVGLTGISGMAAGTVGVIGTVSYANGPGVVLLTRVASRFPVTVCGVLMVVFAFVDKLMALLAIIPGSVVAGAMIAGLATQIGAGISVVTRSGKGLTNRDFLVVGIPILFGGVSSILPGAFFEAFPSAIRALLKNGLVTGVGAVLLLEHGLLRRKKNE
jgi:uracil permease